jgi:hypothetical protein
MHARAARDDGLALPCVRVRVCTAGPRRSTTPLGKASTALCGCSSRTARTPLRETATGSPSTHEAAGVPFVLPLGHCRRRVRSDPLGANAFMNGGCTGVGVRTCIVQQLQRDTVCCTSRTVLFGIDWLHCTETPQRTQTYSAMPVQPRRCRYSPTPPHYGQQCAGRLRENLRKTRAHSTRQSRRVGPLPIGARAVLGD